MAATNDAVAYAEEDYAACATVGFDEGYAPRLKRLLDECAAGDCSVSDAELVEIAKQAHLAAVAWIAR